MTWAPLETDMVLTEQTPQTQLPKLVLQSGQTLHWMREHTAFGSIMHRSQGARRRFLQLTQEEIKSARILQGLKELTLLILAGTVHACYQR